MIDLSKIEYRTTVSGHTYKVAVVTCDFCKVSNFRSLSVYSKLEIHKCKKCAAKGRNHFNRLGKPPPNAQIKCLMTCNFCDKPCNPKTKRSLEKSPNSFCNSSCQVKWQNKNTSFNKGVNNPSYVHGERVNGQLPNYGPGFNSKTKRCVKIRDGYNCQKCKLNFSGSKSKYLDIHHVDHNKYNNQLDNLVCLCKSCHSKTHWEEGKI